MKVDGPKTEGWSRTIHFGANDRPVWIKAVQFWTDRPLSRDRPLSPFWTVHFGPDSKIPKPILIGSLNYQDKTSTCARGGYSGFPLGYYLGPFLGSFLGLYLGSFLGPFLGLYLGFHM